MTEEGWRDRIVGDRMAIDREFADRVANSRFSNAEWNLIMTATDLEIRDPADAEAARLVANTEHVEQVLPELETVRRQSRGAMAGGPDGSDGLIAGIKDTLGLGGSAEDFEAERAAAEDLTDEYARRLQAHLEEHGRWSEVREAATTADPA